MIDSGWTLAQPRANTEGRGFVVGAWLPVPGETVGAGPVGGGGTALEAVEERSVDCLFGDLPGRPTR